MSADIIGDKTRGNNMRVTNSMISNSASAHITNAKNSLLKYSDQYTTQKKIQRPSDDPTVAVRSLKLRTTYSQLTQYAEKNVPGCHELDGHNRDCTGKYIKEV